MCNLSNVKVLSLILNAIKFNAYCFVWKIAFLLQRWCSEESKRLNYFTYQQQLSTKCPVTGITQWLLVYQTQRNFISFFHYKITRIVMSLIRLAEYVAHNRKLTNHSEFRRRVLIEDSTSWIQARVIKFYFFFWLNRREWVRVESFLMFLDHTQ